KARKPSELGVIAGEGETAVKDKAIDRLADGGTLEGGDGAGGDGDGFGGWGTGPPEQTHQKADISRTPHPTFRFAKAHLLPQGEKGIPCMPRLLSPPLPLRERGWG